MSNQGSGFAFLIVVGTIGILAAIFMPESSESQFKQEVVENNAYFVRLAVEYYAVLRDGYLPDSQVYISPTNPLPFIKLFPNGQKLKNPFTGEFTEPRSTLASPPANPEPGAIYYYFSRDLYGQGYVILGYGKYPEKGPIIELTR